MADRDDNELEEEMRLLNERLDRFVAGVETMQQEHQKEVASLTREIEAQKTANETLVAENQTIRGQHTAYMSRQTTQVGTVRSTRQRVEDAMNKYKIPLAAVAVALFVGGLLWLFPKPYAVERAQLAAQTEPQKQEVPPAGFLLRPAA